MSLHDRASRPLPARAGATVAALTALLVASVAGLSTGVAGGGVGGATPDGEEWRPLLLRAAEASQERGYSGEALTIVWSDGQPQVSISRVHRDRDALTVSSTGRFTVRLGHDGGDMADHRQGWLAPLPPVAAGGPAEAVRALEHKYAVVVAGQERLLDRPCARLEVRRRADGSLRERLWVDQDSGLVLRRESYEGVERRLRLVAYLSLDLRGGSAVQTGPRVSRSRTSASLDRRAQEVSMVDGSSIPALREAGWAVPTALPWGYEPVGAYAVDDAAGQPLQVVYRDGLYTMSVFQQRGRPDWTSLPDGAQRVEGLDWPAFEWPGAVPRRLVWEASGTTFSLVGDAPPEEFLAIAEALPRPQAPSLTRRLRRGFSRLFAWMPQ